MRYYRLKGNMKKESLRLGYSLRTLLALVNLSQGFGVLTQGPGVRPGKNHGIGDGGNSYYSIPESLGLLHRISTQVSQTSENRKGGNDPFQRKASDSLHLHHFSAA